MHSNSICIFFIAAYMSTDKIMTTIKKKGEDEGIEGGRKEGRESAFFFGSSIVDSKRRVSPWQNISASLGIALSRPGILLSLPLKHPLQLAFHLATRTKYQRHGAGSVSLRQSRSYTSLIDKVNRHHTRINIQGPCACHPLCISSYPADFNARSLRLTRCERESRSEIRATTTNKRAKLNYVKTRRSR